MPQPAPLGPPALSAPATAAFGANVNRLFNDRTYTPAQIASQLAALRRTGGTIARSDALWEVSEPRPGGYDWTFDDQIAAALATSKLRWLPIVDYSPAWASSVPGQVHAPPRSAQDYAAFAGALVARYGPGGTFWRSRPDLMATPVDTYEIWNEPDSPSFWLPGPSAARYDELYLLARDAIKRADPRARVIVGGLTAAPTFLPAMLAARPGMNGHIDGVGIHPYGPSPPAVLRRVAGARRTLTALGMADVPLYITELGWATSPPGALSFVSEGQRPGYISRTIAALGHSDCGVAATTIYTWVTPERSRDDSQDWFGIHPPRGGSSPDTRALAEGLGLAAAPGPATPICGRR